MIINSLIIPCFNEEGNIDELINNCKNFIIDNSNELILVNNGSTDKTYDKISYYEKKYNNVKCLHINKNIGFGHGVLEGIKISKGENIIYTHADSETDPKDVLIGIKLIPKNNSNKYLIKGNRINRIKNNWSHLDMLISSSLSVITSVIFLRYVFDSHAQPVIFNKQLTKSFKNPPKDFMLDIYIHILAIRQKYQIKRFPVNFNKSNRKHGEGSNDSTSKKLIGIFNHLFKLFILRINL